MFTICRRLFNGCNVAKKTSCTTGHLTFLKTSQLAGCWWTGVSRQQDISSVQGDRLRTVSKSVCTVKIFQVNSFLIQKQYEMEICFYCHYYISYFNHQRNTQLIESCIHVAIITARWTFNQDGTMTDKVYLSNFPWPSVLTVQSC